MDVSFFKMWSEENALPKQETNTLTSFTPISLAKHQFTDKKCGNWTTTLMSNQVKTGSISNMCTFAHAFS